MTDNKIEISCEICGHSVNDIVYRGPVRDGSFGNLSEADAVITRCATCGVERLDEESCRSNDIYETKEYRSILDESTDSEGFFEEHDKQQIINLNALWPHSLRNKVIADIGCAAGSFLDHVKGLSGKVIAVDPCLEYHEFLRSRGYEVYPYVKDALVEFLGLVDVVFCFSVVEHVLNPVQLLNDISLLLKPNGILILSTPNRCDILMELLPDFYPSFFYRTVHRWYFDMNALRYCVKKVGFNVLDEKCIHRFGLSNTLAWLRDRKPTGDKSFPNITKMLDNVWKSYLEEHQLGDYLYMIAQNCSKKQMITEGVFK